MIALLGVEQVPEPYPTGKRAMENKTGSLAKREDYG
jgi:hypothetical protein